MSLTQMHSVGMMTAPNLQDPNTEAFRQIHRLAFTILANVLLAEGCESVSLMGEEGNPAAVRRELLFTLHKCGHLNPILGSGGELPADERSCMKLMRRALPTDPATLALIFLVRGLSEDDPQEALREIADAAEWSRRAVLSPL